MPCPARPLSSSGTSHPGPRPALAAAFTATFTVAPAVAPAFAAMLAHLGHALGDRVELFLGQRSVTVRVETLDDARPPCRPGRRASRSRRATASRRHPRRGVRTWSPHAPRPGRSPRPGTRPALTCPSPSVSRAAKRAARRASMSSAVIWPSPFASSSAKTGGRRPAPAHALAHALAIGPAPSVACALAHALRGGRACKGARRQRHRRRDLQKVGFRHLSLQSCPACAGSAFAADLNSQTALDRLSVAATGRILRHRAARTFRGVPSRAGMAMSAPAGKAGLSMYDD